MLRDLFLLNCAHRGAARAGAIGAKPRPPGPPARREETGELMVMCWRRGRAPRSPPRRPRSWPSTPLGPRTSCPGGDPPADLGGPSARGHPSSLRTAKPIRTVCSAARRGASSSLARSRSRLSKAGMAGGRVQAPSAPTGSSRASRHKAGRRRSHPKGEDRVMARRRAAGSAGRRRSRANTSPRPASAAVGSGRIR